MLLKGQQLTNHQSLLRNWEIWLLLKWKTQF